ncbi:restriction endonuclease subunit S [Uliginosibacterium paludis]|uniref:Restriction endonuclease subunit S n=1 Tax=Uliginosibacterium paludis TaxID=1615952 RepID=A0ABV2CVQ4_9RHOO
MATGFLSVLDVQGGTQPPKSEFIYEPREGYVQLLQIRDFGDRAVPTYIPDTNKLKKCSEADVLIARYGASLGRILTGMTGAYNVAMAKVDIPPAMERRFVYYLLKSECFQAPLRLVSRSAQNGFNKEDLSGFEIPLAPLPEQKRIADKLDSTLARVEACRDRLDRLPALLKRFRQSILAAATSGRLTEDWRATRSPDEAQRNPGTTVPESGADDQRPPKGWNALTVRDLALDLRYGTSQKCDYREGGLPVLRIPNIGEGGKVDLTDIKRADFASKEAEKLALQAGDLLLIRSNGSVDLVGKCCIVEGDAVGHLFAGYLMRLRTDPKKILPWFLYFGFSAPAQRQRVELISKSTSGVNNINSDEVKSLPLLVPPLEEQHEIVRRVETLFAFADRLEARLTTARKQAEQLTPALLARAFRGELVPQDPNDEPATELLKRLATTRSEAPKAKRGRKAANA